MKKATKHQTAPKAQGAEHKEMFPKAESTGLDMAELGARLSERKAEQLTGRP